MYHHWKCTSIYRPLSYPFRLLVLVAMLRKKGGLPPPGAPDWPPLLPQILVPPSSILRAALGLSECHWSAPLPLAGPWGAPQPPPAAEAGLTGGGAPHPPPPPLPSMPPRGSICMLEGAEIWAEEPHWLAEGAGVPQLSSLPLPEKKCF